MKAIGKVNIYFIDRGINKPTLHRLHVLIPFLKALPYVGEVKPHEGEPIHWNASDFRQYHQWTHSIARSHFLHYKGSTSQTHQLATRPTMDHGNPQ